jgi:hypothetical protein
MVPKDYQQTVEDASLSMQLAISRINTPLSLED